MAKISARGATEVARIKVHRETLTTPIDKLYVLTSDGRVLTRYVGEAGTGYTVRMTPRQYKAITWGSSTTTPRDKLIRIAAHDGYENVIG